MQEKLEKTYVYKSLKKGNGGIQKIDGVYFQGHSELIIFHNSELQTIFV